MKGVVICGVVVVAMIQWMMRPGAAISCADVVGLVAQCPPYLTGAAPQPNPECCGGLKKLVGIVTTDPERHQACNCLKQAISGFPNLKDAALTSLPAKCGVSVPFPMSRDINCDKIP